MARTAPAQLNQMPNESEWVGVTVQQEAIQASQPYGRVDGIDYVKWAVAWEDAQQTEQRLAARVKSLANKGYKEVPGEWFVHGVDSPVRVWVMPRHLYEERRKAKEAALVDRVQRGLYPESALPCERTRRA